jgi:UDP-3-O-[3-hydroxymyristoyl] N-acetylglucosamine deacetylase/3-hydroxyacyl-[acyl-carrier-protein] dehydratase
MSLRQKTISQTVSLEGPGLFSGERATLTFEPAGAGSGITFVREQNGKMATIQGLVANVMNRPRRTCLHNGTLLVETVEHCMAALAGMGVDNAVVRVSGGTVGELPGGDGSSALFAEAIQRAGLVEQDASLEPLVITKPIQVIDEDASIAALPGPKDHLELIYDFEAPPPVGRQIFAFRTGGDEFLTQLAPARTFIFEPEAIELRERGIGKHLSPKELLVISDTGPIDNAFRFADECARHKLLDMLGDLYLVGRPLCGRIIARKSGHAMNHRMARKLLELNELDARQSLLSRDAALDIRKIQRILPHRYPMLLVDRVLEIVGDEKAIGIKNVTFNDIFFQGHYPGTPIMPGVLIVEAMAQLGGLLLSQKLEHTGKLAVLLSMDKVKMRHPAVPGDQLILEAVTVRVKSRTGHVRCKAFVQDNLAAEADIKFMLVDAEPV